MSASALPPFLQRFFTDRLNTQMAASPNTVASYRDAFRLLLRFASDRRGRAPTNLRVEDLDADLIGDFLVHVETARGNSVRSRNTRLAAIRSFFRYVALNEPALALHCQRVLAMPSKRAARRPVDFLTRPEMDAVLAAPDRSHRAGRRDYALLLVALRTGLRVSELVHLRRRDVVFGTGAHVRCDGKGRKQRCTPLRGDTRTALESWLAETGGVADAFVFPNHRGGRLSRDAVERLVRKHATAGARACPTLAGKRVTPHVLRHSTAMELLQSGVDPTVIALWLGHESVETTNMYLHADLQLKEQALARLAETTNAAPGRYRPDDDLLAFLESL
jgi:integrase/recombinase XerD